LPALIGRHFNLDTMEDYKDIEFGPVEGKPDLPEQTPIDEQKIAADMQDWRESR